MTAIYRVTPALPHEHLFEVEARLPAGRAALDLWLPVWTPGSYLVREFARHLQDFSATDPAGAPLPVERLDKHTWRVRAGGCAEVTARYRVYANELTVRTSHLDGSHGYFNGANLFVTTDEAQREPCELELAGLPPGWRAFCALPSRDGRFLARDFDELVDSPVELGPHQPLRFEAAGVPHEVVVWGEGNLVPERLTADLKTIAETEAALFGGLPFERYLFIVHLTDKGRGGLEHAASTSLLAPRSGFEPRKAYEDFLALAAHEYFHAWNVKRIKPKALVPFDYRRENYTRLLWAMEGITSYYDTLLLRRAGLIDAKRYLERLGEAITALESVPARRAMTLSDASLLAWIKHYRPDENTPNSGISYYIKGEVVAALLDLELRAAGKSLDDLMRALFSRYGDGRGVPEDGVEAAARELGGERLAAFFERSVRSTEELDYAPFSAVGLKLSRRARKGSGDKGGTAEGPTRPTPWLGLELKSGERAVVETVLTGSPAARAGIYAGDELLALDGFRVTSASLPERLADKPAGTPCRVALFRRDRLQEVEVVPQDAPKDACYLEKDPAPSEVQRALFQQWLGEAL